jgi:hypothetical protein
MREVYDIRDSDRVLLFLVPAARDNHKGRRDGSLTSPEGKSDGREAAKIVWCSKTARHDSPDQATIELGTLNIKDKDGQRRTS